MTAHRAGPPRRAAWPRTAVTLVVGLLLGAGTALVVTEQEPSPRLAATSATPTSTPSATVSPSPSTSTPAPAPTAVDAVAAAQQVKPLRDLVEGDRVLYVAEAGARGVLCTWVLWDESIATSTVTCGAETFQTPTGYLTPLETR